MRMIKRFVNNLCNSVSDANWSMLLHTNSSLQILVCFVPVLAYYLVTLTLCFQERRALRNFIRRISNLNWPQKYTGKPYSMIGHHEKRRELDQEQCTMKLQMSYVLYAHNRGLDLIINIRYSCFDMIDHEMANKRIFPFRRIDLVYIQFTQIHWWNLVCKNKDIILMWPKCNS